MYQIKKFHNKKGKKIYALLQGVTQLAALILMTIFLINLKLTFRKIIIRFNVIKFLD